MSRFIVFAALISISQLVEPAPQSFGQSFSSSSITKPNGQVVTSSIYTDSKGNRVVNGPALKIPPLSNDLLPPFVPGEVFKPIAIPLQPFQPLVPVIPPASVTTRATTKAPVVTTRAPVVTTKAPVVTTKAPVVTTKRTTVKASVTTTAKIQPTTTTRATTRAPLVTSRVTSAPKQAKSVDPESIANGQYVPDKSGAYVHDPKVGAYVHDKTVGAYTPDDRGKYRAQ